MSARGVVLVITDANTIQGLPDSFQTVANGTILGIPNLLIIFVVITAIAWFVLNRTVFGRYVYAVGSNPEAARLAGVPVAMVTTAVYVIAGVLAAVGGVLLTSRLGAGVPTAGTGFELQAIAACVIGGASLSGARGSAIGAACGALIIGVLNNGGNLLAINAFYLQIAIGALVLVAVGFDQMNTRRVNFLCRMMQQVTLSLPKQVHRKAVLLLKAQFSGFLSDRTCWPVDNFGRS
jgi:ribose transport system permease protein